MIALSTVQTFGVKDSNSSVALLGRVVELDLNVASRQLALTARVAKPPENYREYLL